MIFRLRSHRQRVPIPHVCPALQTLSEIITLCILHIVTTFTAEFYFATHYLSFLWNCKLKHCLYRFFSGFPLSHVQFLWIYWYTIRREMSFFTRTISTHQLYIKKANNCTKYKTESNHLFRNHSYAVVCKSCLSIVSAERINVRQNCSVHENHPSARYV